MEPERGSDEATAAASALPSSVDADNAAPSAAPEAPRSESLGTTDTTSGSGASMRDDAGGSDELSGAESDDESESDESESDESESDDGGDDDGGDDDHGLLSSVAPSPRPTTPATRPGS